MTRCHFSDTEARLDAEARLEQQIKDRQAIKLKYYRLRRVVRAGCKLELDDLRKEESQEMWSLPRLSIPEWYWNAYD